MLIEKFYKILCFFIDTLVNAEKRAKKAENTSHLSSDSSSQEFLSWKQLKKNLFDIAIPLLMKKTYEKPFSPPIKRNENDIEMRK